MTEISAHAILCNERIYSIVDQSRHLKARDFGLSAARYHSTNPTGGFLYTLALNKNKLYLEELSCYIDPPKGLFTKLKYAVRKYPPRINNVEPLLEDDPCHNTKGNPFPCFVWYHELSFPLKFSGRIKAVLSDFEILDIHVDRPETYTELLILTFKRGKLISMNRIEGNARMG